MTPLMFVPTAVKATTTARVTRAAATAYSESSSPDSSERNDLIIIFSLALCKALAPLTCGYLILFARLLITPLMLLPSVVKMPTTASAIKAAATAYSESSKPVSSRRKFLIMFLLLRFGLRVKHCALTHHASSSLAEGPSLREFLNNPN